ncbi:hypothetical protein EON83_26625 [bacterium]|nr:MAG: hypothetical protein EON83_26625 [bacterium]
MQGEYKLLRVKQGICHFAHVTIEVELMPSGVEVTEQVERLTEYQSNSPIPYIASEWIEAAISGAKRGARALLHQEVITGCHVVVQCVVGVEVDTTPEDVACAATLATWSALNPEAPLPQFDFIDRKWHITL